MTRIITQKFIFRSDLRANPKVMYLFGDNLLRVGRGGQAKEMRGEPNAIGIATKRAPGRADQDFFNDLDYHDLADAVAKDIAVAAECLKNGALLVIPEDGLGTGLSELPERAPRVNAFLLDQIAKLYQIGR